MKTNRLLVFIFTMTLLSCEKADTNNESSVLTTLKGESGLSYDESLSKWKALKSKNGNSYAYETTFSSWTGFAGVTEVTVIDGVVTTRIYHEYKINEANGERDTIDSYTETKADLGIHEKGAKPITIDEFYNSCASDYLVVDEKRNTLYFETEVNGLMNLCGFAPIGCMDDCYTGIRINSFGWIE